MATELPTLRFYQPNFEISHKVVKLYRKVKKKPNEKNIEAFKKELEKFMKLKMEVLPPGGLPLDAKNRDEILDIMKEYFEHMLVSYICSRNMNSKKGRVWWVQNQETKAVFQKVPFGLLPSNSVCLFVFRQTYRPNFLFDLFRKQLVQTWLQKCLILTQEQIMDSRLLPFMTMFRAFITSSWSCHSTRHRLRELSEFKLFKNKFPYFMNQLRHLSQNVSKMSAEDMKKLVTCAGCGQSQTHANEFLKCEACRLVYYCGKKCQKTHWRRDGHKQECIAIIGDN